MSGRSRAQREVVETSTDDEARIIINSPEDLQAGLDRLTFEPSQSPDPPDVGPSVFAQALQHIAERDEARRERDEQAALRADRSDLTWCVRPTTRACRPRADLLPTFSFSYHYSRISQMV